MSTSMPVLHTRRLTIRPFVQDDLNAVHSLLDLDLKMGLLSLAERRRWLEWTILSYEQLANLNQPPYGDRAVVMEDTGILVGVCGYAPVLAPLCQIPGVCSSNKLPASLHVPETGLFWAVSSQQQGQGIATEAGQALIVYAFQALRLARIVATTEFTNLASIGVMRNLGMQIERNPFPEPEWLQIIGVLNNPSPKE